MRFILDILKVWQEDLILKLEQDGIFGKWLHLIKDFLSDRKQLIVLNGHGSSWMDLQAGVPQGSILRPLLFLICINDLPDDLTSNPNMFSDESTLFFTVTDQNAMANQINNDLHNINTWFHQWKINFNPDTNKQTQEVIFICKIKVSAHPQLVFNNNPVHEITAQKHHGMFLNFKLHFLEYFEKMLNKVNKTIRLLRKLQNTHLRTSLLTI